MKIDNGRELHFKLFSEFGSVPKEVHAMVGVVVTKLGIIFSHLASLCQVREDKYISLTM